MESQGKEGREERRVELESLGRVHVRGRVSGGGGGGLGDCNSLPAQEDSHKDVVSSEESEAAKLQEEDGWN